MGAKSTTTNNQQNNKQDIIGNNHHPKLINAKVIQNAERSYLKVINSISNKELFQNWKNNVKKYEQYQNIDSLYLPLSMQFQTDGLCGSSGIVKSQFQVLPFILSQEIANRKDINQPFLQKQLWYLIYSLTYTGHLIHSHNNLIGDVRPQNIFISEDGDIKMSTIYTFYDEQTNYQKTLILKQITLLSPEQMKDLQNGRDQPTHHAPTSQTFSIGITILSGILLDNLSYLYGQDFNFNQVQFNKCIKGLRSSQSYSLLLRKIVEGMCKKNPSDRLTCSDVVSILKPAQQKILNLQQFSVNEIPTELKNKVQMINSSNINKVVNPGYNIGARNSVSNISKLQTPYNILQSPINEQMILQSPSNDQRIHQSHGNEQIILQSPGNDQRIHQSLGNEQIILQSPGNDQRILQSHGNESLIIQSSTNEQRTSFTNQPPVNSSYIRESANFQIRQSNNIHQIPVSNPSINQNSMVTNSQFTNNSQFQIISPQSRNSVQKFQQSNNTFNSGLYDQSQMSNKKYIEQPRFISSYQQEPVQHTTSNYQPTSNVSYNFSKIKSPQVLEYGSKIQSYIPSQQPIQNHHIMIKQSQNSKLAQMGRQTTSIRPPTDHNYTNVQYNKVQGNIHKDDELFRSYEHIMKNVDKQLRDSRKMFPDQQ